MNTTNNSRLQIASIDIGIFTFARIDGNIRIYESPQNNNGFGFEIGRIEVNEFVNAWGELALEDGCTISAIIADRARDFFCAGVKGTIL
jgi:hypothetical protein